MRTAALLCLLAIPSAAHAQVQRDRIAILARALAPEGDDGEVTPAFVIDVIARAITFAPRLELVSRAELLAGGLEDRLRACDAELGCVSEQLGAARIPLAFIAIADVRGTPGIASLELVDARSGAVLGRSIVEVDTGSARAPALAAALRGESEKLLREAGHGLHGRVIVEVRPADAVISLGPNVRADTGNTFLLEPGRHVVLATRDGYEQGSVEAVAEAGREVKVELELRPAASLVESPWLWLGICLGVAAAGAATVLLVTSQDGPCTCVGLEPPCNGCD